MDTGKTVDKIIRPEILALEPYRSPCFEYEIKLDLNESPFDLPGEVKDTIFERTRGLLWQRYHDEFEEPLKNALAESLGHDSEGVLIGNGSNELIFHTLLASVPTGRAVLFPEPSFSLYAQNVRVLGGKPTPFRLGGEAFSVDPGEVISLARKSRSAAVVLCSPNNPTGGRIQNDALEEIVRSVESTAVVVVDEAYAQFAEDNAFRLVEKYPNLVVLRTFSKAFGMAGLRFGFGVCRPELAAQIAKVQLPHHVNFFTQVAALTLVERPELVRERVNEIIEGRAYIERELETMPGVRVYPSEANFIMIELTEKPPAEVFNGLLAGGILIRNISSYPGLARCLRITVGQPADNRAFIRALREVME